MRHQRVFTLSVLAAGLFSTVGAAQTMPNAVARLHDTSGADVGSVDLQATPSGVVRIVVALKGLPPGIHAIHIHERGDCSAPDFTSAGGHLAGGKEHGIESHGGPHAGDLPNLHVPASGAVAVEYFNGAVSLGSDGSGALFGKDGTAVIVHAKPDDYKSQPSGDAGGRIACGVITRSQ